MYVYFLESNTLVQKKSQVVIKPSNLKNKIPILGQNKVQKRAKQHSNSNSNNIVNLQVPFSVADLYSLARRFG